MPERNTARKIFIALLLVFAATLTTLLCRQFSVGPARSSPAFRAFGPETAKIRIYEYTDFACPHCRLTDAHVNKMLELYKGSVRLDFKHYPLTSIHPWSFTAAAYADCAGGQGKFREYADLLFEGQEQWARSKDKPREFTEYARRLKLDMPALEKCAEDPVTLRRIRLDSAEGDLRGVDATPTFFINGKRAVGPAQLLEHVRKLDNLLVNRNKPSGESQEK
ncbi:MAG TPA: hypothetical protein DCZ93_11450 [Elusimicrobia bacterium]|nr:hypothetical protein [Elusimicrobiota bacterium]